MLLEVVWMDVKSKYIDVVGLTVEYSPTADNQKKHRKSTNTSDMRSMQ